MPEVWKRLYFSTLRESRGCETCQSLSGMIALPYFSTLRESRGCETEDDGMVFCPYCISVLSASRGGVRPVDGGSLTNGDVLVLYP